MTIYKIVSLPPNGEQPIISLHTDYKVVEKMVNNMRKADYKVNVYFSNSAWRQLIV